MRNHFQRERCAAKIVARETVTSAEVLQAFGFEITQDKLGRRRCRSPIERHWRAVPDVARSVDDALYFFDYDERETAVLEAAEYLFTLGKPGYARNTLALALCVIALRGTPHGILVGRWLYA